MILQPSITKSRIFIPEWMENKDANTDDQIRIHYRPVTVKIKERIFSS